MRLDNKLKIAAFDTAMKSLLKNKNKYPDRTARNILESGAAVFHRSMNEDEKKNAFLHIKEKLPERDEDILAFIRDLVGSN